MKNKKTLFALSLCFATIFTASAESEKAIEAKATEEKATEAKATEAKATEAKATEAKATEAKATEEKATEEKATEEKAIEEKATEEKATEAKATEAKATEAKTTEAKSTEAKTTEAKATEPTPAKIMHAEPVTILYASRPNQGSPDGKDGSPFANSIVKTLRNIEENASQQTILSAVRSDYRATLDSLKITQTDAYLVNPWTDGDAPICGKSATYVITIGANDYSLGRLRNAVPDANRVEYALGKYCPNAKTFSLRELAFSSDSVFTFLDDLASISDTEERHSLIFYYSGFGASNNNKRYLLSPLTKIGRGVRDLKNAKESIVVGELEKKIATLGKNWRVTVFLDTGFPYYGVRK